MTQHEHKAVANTDEVFLTFVGCRVKGLIHPPRDANYNILLLFDCGWGIGIGPLGGYWTERPEYIKRILDEKKQELLKNQKELEYILKVAGE